MLPACGVDDLVHSVEASCSFDLQHELRLRFVEPDAAARACADTALPVAAAALWCDHAPFRSWPGAAVAAAVAAMLLFKLVALGVVSHGCSALKAVALYQVPTLLPLLLCGVIADAAALATLGPNSDGRCP